MARTINRKAAAAVLAPVAASVIGIGMNAGVAHADIHGAGSLPVTFLNRSGATVHCTIAYGWDLGVPVLDAYAAAYGDPGCTASNAGVRVTYRTKDTNQPAYVSVSGAGGFVFGEWNNVKDARFDTYHDVYFGDCDVNVSQCDFSFHLSHGK